MATQETQREWLGLGQMGWGIYAVIALATLYNELQMPDQGLPIVLIAAIVVVLPYLIVRFWKAVFRLLGVVSS